MSGLVVPGAVVMLLDARGHTGARTISNESGRFTLQAPAGAVTVRAIRIGFVPRTLPVPADPARRAHLDIRMLGLPTLLAGVRVSDQAICPGKDDRNGALALWEQARAGLLATVVARQTSPGRMTVVNYTSDEDPDSHVVVRQTQQMAEGTTGRPFVAVNQAAGFSRHGYMEGDSTGLSFFAPDADVLLDPAFAQTHCFRVERDGRGHPGQVGLGFEPAPGDHPDGYVDVRGALWMDSRHPALRSLEFAYTGLPAAYHDANMGGALVFRNVPNGLTYIERWQLSLAQIAIDANAGHEFSGNLGSRSFHETAGSERARVLAYRRVGSDVLSARWPDGVSAASPVGTVTGLVRDPARHPIAGVSVLLEGTGLSAHTDSSGTFTLWPVIPGKYGLELADSTFAQFADPRQASTQITVGHDTLALAPLEMPSHAETATRLCHRAPPDSLRETTIVLGRVSGALPPDTRVAGSWSLSKPGVPESLHGGRELTVATNEGRFLACYLPPGALLQLHLMRGDSTVADTVVSVQRGGVQRVEWRVKQ